MSPAALDLDPQSRRSLEFDGLLDWIAALARTVPGVPAVRALRPLADAPAARTELSAVDEL
ncbi:MAG TPA: hypothetical protein VJS92_12685, partial [Candidatus Polarisedimenticolaceae bacterium]|nr:hypothetical protein [Candidatus Polarisedimenticolaceae bacterium]